MSISSGKLICIIGSSFQKVLLPLLQFWDRFSSALFITPKRELETVKYIQSFIECKESYHCSTQLEVVSNTPDYDSFYEMICGILWDSFSKNEQTVLNISGGTAYMILAAVHAAKAMRTPVMYVDSNRQNIQIIEWQDNESDEMIRTDHFDMRGCEVKDVLAFCDFKPSYLLVDATDSGIQYERWIYDEFQKAKEESIFDSIDRNMLLTWNSKGDKNEIDILFLRNHILGFISVKSGKWIQNRKTSEELKNIYPQWLLRYPCLRVLLSRYPVNEEMKTILSEAGVLVFDNILAGSDIRNAIGLIAAEADRLLDANRSVTEDPFEQMMEFADGEDEF